MDVRKGHGSFIVGEQSEITTMAQQASGQLAFLQIISA